MEAILCTVIAGASAIICSSLWFADRLLKREAEEDARDKDSTLAPMKHYAPIDLKELQRKEDELRRALLDSALELDKHRWGVGPDSATYEVFESVHEMNKKRLNDFLRDAYGHSSAEKGTRK